METSDRPPPTDLTEQFEQTPFAFDFFRAVRLLEARYSSSPRVGTSHDPRQDPIRFGQTPSLAFAPSALEAFRRGEGGRPGKLLVRFFGLFGPNGPLPIHLTEYAHGRQLQAKDNTFVEFCDMFHHRLLSCHLGDVPIPEQLCRLRQSRIERLNTRHSSRIPSDPSKPTRAPATWLCA